MLRSVRSGKFLHVPEEEQGDGKPIVQWPSDSDGSQWHVEVPPGETGGSIMLRSVRSGKYLHRPGRAAGRWELWQWHSKTVGSQWHVEAIETLGATADGTAELETSTPATDEATNPMLSGGDGSGSGATLSCDEDIDHEDADELMKLLDQSIAIHTATKPVARGHRGFSSRKSLDDEGSCRRSVGSGVSRSILTSAKEMELSERVAQMPCWTGHIILTNLAKVVWRRRDKDGRFSAIDQDDEANENGQLSWGRCLLRSEWDEVATLQLCVLTEIDKIGASPAGMARMYQEPRWNLHTRKQYPTFDVKRGQLLTAKETQPNVELNVARTHISFAVNMTSFTGHDSLSQECTS